MGQITVGEFSSQYGTVLELEVVAGKAGMDRCLTSSDVHRPGLALAGFVGLFTYDRVQVLGNTEMLYLSGLDHDQAQTVLNPIFQFDIPCLVITDGNEVPSIMATLSEQHSIPLLKTPFSTTKFSHLFTFHLDDVFSPQATIHGSLVDVYGIGLLIVGRSGIGKSEIAIDLVERGHRLVADDVVLVSRKVRHSHPP